MAIVACLHRLLSSSDVVLGKSSYKFCRSPSMGIMQLRWLISLGILSQGLRIAPP